MLLLVKHSGQTTPKSRKQFNWTVYAQVDSSLLEMLCLVCHLALYTAYGRSLLQAFMYVMAEWQTPTHHVWPDGA